MGQLSYSINTPAVSFPGQPADLTNLVATSAMAVAAPLAYGTLAVRDTANSSGIVEAGKAPALAADITTLGNVLGVVLADQARAQDPSVSVAQYPIGSAVPTMRKGRAWVVVEEAVNAGDPVFVRFATGTGTQLGAFRKSADTATAAQLPTAVYRSAAGAAGYAILEMDLV